MFFKKNKTNTAHIQSLIDEYRIDGVGIGQFVQKMALDGTTLALDMRLPESLDVERIHAELGSLLHLHGVGEINMNVMLTKDTPTAPTAKTFTPNKPSQAGEQGKTMAQDTLTAHPRIRHIIAIASGKGGVGKSTTAVNIALALKKLGNKVGMLDADIYGPSLPDMLGVAHQKPALENGEFVPLDGFGMPVISIGNLIDTDATPIAWRGIKATGALMQMYNQTAFGHLDYLIIDMPPGTGDIALTLAQKIPITGAVIVTTPQHIALLDVKKGVELFNKTHIPVLGIVENMALHTCQNCGHTDAIFGEHGADEMAKSYGVPLLGRLPLARGIREQMDKGEPSVAIDDDHAKFYIQIAENIITHIDKFAKVRDDKRIF